MSPPDALRVGYVVKRYPRYSETFIVNEILAHEQADCAIEIFSLRPPVDTHFQDCIARVRAPVAYLCGESVKAEALWAALSQAADDLPGIGSLFEAGQGTEAAEVYQAVTLALLVQRRGIDLLHAHFASSATTVARLASKLANVPFTFTAHAKDIFHEAVDHENLRRNLEAAAAVITVSDFNVQYLRQKFGPAADRVHRIYNGLHLDRFTYQPPVRRPPRIVAVGRLVEKKGFGDLIEACAILARRSQDFSCEIIGTGDREAALREQIVKLRLQEHVKLLGPRPQAEVIERLHGASACAAPCVVGEDGNRDGLPTVLLEAMALGTPCVATDVTGIPEVLRHGETGLMVRQRDPAHLAEALCSLLRDEPLRLRLATAARRWIEQNFDVERNAARQRELFRSAVQVRPRENDEVRELQEVS